MYQLSDFKKGLKILVEGEPFTVTDFQHVKPGKGNQFTRCKARNLITGQNPASAIPVAEAVIHHLRDTTHSDAA